jgi:hypothetical protein
MGLCLIIICLPIAYWVIGVERFPNKKITHKQFYWGVPTYLYLMNENAELEWMSDAPNMVIGVELDDIVGEDEVSFGGWCDGCIINIKDTTVQYRLNVDWYLEHIFGWGYGDWVLSTILAYGRCYTEHIDESFLEPSEINYMGYYIGQETRSKINEIFNDPYILDVVEDAIKNSDSSDTRSTLLDLYGDDRVFDIERVISTSLIYSMGEVVDLVLNDTSVWDEFTYDVVYDLEVSKSIYRDETLTSYFRHLLSLDRAELSKYSGVNEFIIEIPMTINHYNEINLSDMLTNLKINQHEWMDLYYETDEVEEGFQIDDRFDEVLSILEGVIYDL